MAAELVYDTAERTIIAALALTVEDIIIKLRFVMDVELFDKEDHAGGIVVRHLIRSLKTSGVRAAN